MTLSRPQGDFTVRPDAPYHLFAGEETASHLPLPRPLTRVERGVASAAGSQVLVAAVRALDLTATPGVAYLAGEARTLVTERGWHRRDIRTKPFLTPGKRGME